jgi:flagellar biosynthesis activator protein FlaF
MSLQAYQQAAQRAENPRDTEYRLFALVTRALIDASESDALETGARVAALDWNRRLWSVLANDCAKPENRLPDVLKARIISLSLWVNRHTSAVARREATFDLLIEVNRTVMQGLTPTPQAEAA